MHTTNILHLASQSPIRKRLLTKCAIPFTTIEQTADERSIDWNQPAHIVTSLITQLKMDHAVMPSSADKVLYVLTADTVAADHSGKIHGKPADLEDARYMIKLWRQGCHITTSFCLDKKEQKENQWITLDRIEQTVSSSLIFNIPDQWIEDYLQRINVLEIAGAVAIEGYGLQFVKSVEGSYSTILGLPMYELMKALNQLHFFSASLTF